MGQYPQPDSSPLAGRPIRWAIAGTGLVAAKFATQLRTIPDARLHAVVSASPENAVRFTQVHGGRPCMRFADVLADPLIDIVYIATPTRWHAEHSCMALSSGKAVLCEKPFARSKSEAAQIMQLAREQQRFCMEAMWMRFNPMVQEVKRLLQQGRIGALRAAHIATGYLREDSLADGADPATGAMLRFGCYGVSLAHFLLGNPRCAVSQVQFLPTGVDETASALLDYGKTTVSLMASIGVTLTNEAIFLGDRGRLVVQSPWFNSTALTTAITHPDEPCRWKSRKAQPIHAPHTRTLSPKYGDGHFGRFFRRVFARFQGHSRDETVTVIGDPAHRDAGLRLEATEAMRCLRAGLTESPVVPLEESLAVHCTIDAILDPASTRQTEACFLQ